MNHQNCITVRIMEDRLLNNLVESLRVEEVVKGEQPL